MGHKLKRLIELLDIRKALKFSVIGVLNTGVDFGIFYILNEIIAVNVYAAQTISFLVATLNSFLFNKYWTFGKKNPVNRREVVRYLVVQSGYLLLSLGIMYVWSGTFQFTPMVAKALTAVMMIAYNYLLDKFWVFN